VGRPAGALPADEVAGWVAEGRFRRETASLLSAPIEDEVLFQFARAPAIAIDSPAFWGVAPESGKRSMAIARRTSTAPWTLVARVPESEVLGPARELAAREVGLGVTAILVAAAIGVLLVRVQQRRFHAMVAAADAVANGHLDIRIPDPGKDEIGRLASGFNVMADALAHTRADLEARVAERTSALATANNELERHQEELFKQRDELMAQQEELQRQTVELERRTAEAETADRQKSEILTLIASKLRGPLSSVITHSDLLLGAEGGGLNEQQREFLEAIASAGRQQLSLLTDTIEWSELQAGHLQLAREALPVERLLHAARDAIALQAGRKQITVTASSRATRLVFADARRVHHVLVHLLSNAVRFSPTASHVELTAVDDGTMVAIEVADRGPGLPEDMWPRLFQPFQQAGSPLGKGLEGTGVGLAVCRRLVVAQGGTIAAQPREGGGLILRFTLPATTAAVQGEPASP
jgi:signal transduction histidine kinase